MKIEFDESCFIFSIAIVLITFATPCTEAQNATFPLRNIPTGNRPSHLLAADVNQDGLLDLVSANSSSDTISIHIGNGDEGFLPQSTLDLDGFLHEVIAGDFNGDAICDLAVADSVNGTDFDRVWIALGNGDGTFQSLFQVPTLANGPSSLVIIDCDSDGVQDLAVANRFSSEISILRGNGDGTFQEATLFTTAVSPQDILAADVNNDGVTDLVTTSLNPIGVAVHLGIGDGSFSTPLFSETNATVLDFICVNLNDDQTTDLAVATGTNQEILLMAGDGLGGFQLVESLPADGNPLVVEQGDFNNDGLLDIISLNGVGDASIYLRKPKAGKSGELYDGAVDYFVGNRSSSGVTNDLVTGDFDSDGIIDMVATNAQSNSLICIEGNGDGSLNSIGTFSLSPDAFASEIITANINGDDALDLVTANGTTDDISILIGLGDGAFLEPINRVVGNCPRHVVSTDFDADGIADLAAVNRSSDSVPVLIGNGDSTFDFSDIVAIQDEPANVTTGDFNQDSIADLAIAVQGSNEISILFGLGNGRFEDDVRLETEASSIDSVVVLDANNDGIDDLAWAGGGLRVGINDGTGNFDIFQNNFSYFGFRELVAGDFNGDGWTDLVSLRGNVHVFLNEGNGSFANPLIVPTSDNDPPQPIAVVASDFNGDNILDLATLHPSFTTQEPDFLNYLVGTGDGTFTFQGSFAVPRNPGALVAGDLDGNGSNDLAVFCTFNHFVAVYLNQNEVVLLGDVNRDGVVDLLDISPFVNLISSGGFQEEADLNMDGAVDLLDIQLFVDAILG